VQLFCGDIFHGVTHEEFASIFLSPALKCLLRNPDELMRAVSCLLCAISIDCSRYAIEFTKSISGQLSSTNDSTRADTVMFFKRLSSQCSDTDACINVGSYLLDVLIGKDPAGKLSSVDHRQAVLNAISSFSNSPLTAKGYEMVSTCIIDGILSYYKQEVHGGTQVVAMTTIESFCDNFEGKIPKSFSSHLKGSLEGKTTPPQLRLLYWCCIDKLSKGDNKQLIDQYIPVMMQCVEKAKVGAVSVAVLEEAVMLL
jgi:hypothetical protein